MIKDTLWYVKNEAWPRLFQIVSGPELWLSIAISALTAWKGEQFSWSPLKFGEVCSTLLTYDAIAMGFCLAGLTIVLTVPDREFIEQLVSHKREGSRFDSYSGLLFVFSWTAIVHWIAIVSTVIVFLRYGTQSEFLSMAATAKHRLVVGVFTLINVYGLFQFLIMLATLTQVGSLYVGKISKRLTKEAEKKREEEQKRLLANLPPPGPPDPLPSSDTLDTLNEKNSDAGDVKS